MRFAHLSHGSERMRLRGLSGARDTGEALSSLGIGGVLITLGYSAGRKTTIDVTDLIWKGARIGRLLPVRPITDRDRHCVAGHHPADRRRIGQADRRACLSPRRGGRSLAPSK